MTLEQVINALDGAGRFGYAKLTGDIAPAAAQKHRACYCCVGCESVRVTEWYGMIIGTCGRVGEPREHPAPVCGCGVFSVEPGAEKTLKKCTDGQGRIRPDAIPLVQLIVRPALKTEVASEECPQLKWRSVPRA